MIYGFGAKKGQGKYNVAPKETRTLDGIVFDSKAEMDRWSTLKIMERTGLISELERQVKFTLVDGFVHDGKKERPIIYVADFVYRRKGETKLVAEDVKGVSTSVFAMKRKMFLGRYGNEYELYVNKVGRRK